MLIYYLSISLFYSTYCVYYNKPLYSLFIYSIYILYLHTSDYDSSIILYYYSMSSLIDYDSITFIFYYSIIYCYDSFHFIFSSIVFSNYTFNYVLSFTNKSKSWIISYSYIWYLSILLIYSFSFSIIYSILTFYSLFY